MGSGEDYMYDFWNAMETLTIQERKWYFQDFPPPNDWSYWVNNVLNKREDDNPPNNHTK